MTQDPRWIRDDIVYAIHDRQLAEHGGACGVRDPGLLSSALHAPRQLFHYENADLPALAASYAFAIARNHPFIDGNKRVAFVCLRLFLKLNGCDIAATKEEKIQVMTSLAAGGMSRESLTDWTVAHLTSTEISVRNE